MTAAKVLHIYSSVNAGGGMLFVNAIVSAMQEDGNEPHIALRPQSALINRLSEENLIKPEQTHSLPLRNGFDLYSLYKLGKIIRQHNIEIIHAHTGRDYSMAFILAKWLKRKCVFHRHYFRVSPSPVTRYLFRSIDFVITVNKALKSRYIENVGVADDKIAFLPNWHQANSQQVSAKQSKSPNTTFTISMAGNINHNKGQHTFIAAAKRVLATEPNCLFQIIGVNEKNSSSQYFKDLEASIRDAGLSNKIILIDWQSDLGKFYIESNIWIVPSENEAFGRVAIEAMAHKTPVVASDVGGLKEIIQHQVNGLLFQPLDDQALAADIISLLRQPKLRSELAEQALRDANTHYSKTPVLNKLYKIYQQLVAP